MSAMGEFWRWLVQDPRGLRNWRAELVYLAVMAALWLAFGLEWYLVLAGVVLLATMNAMVNFWLWRRDQRQAAPAGETNQA